MPLEPDAITAELLDAIVRTVSKLVGASCRQHLDLFDRTAVRGVGMTAARAQAREVCAGSSISRSSRLIRLHGVVGSESLAPAWADSAAVTARVRALKIR